MKQFRLVHPALEYVEHPEHEGGDFIMVTGHMVVCPECGGEGSHVRRDLDDSAMVDSMREDGDDEGLERYFGGAFDEICRGCSGKNVVLDADYESIPEWAKKAMQSWDDSERESRQIEAQERRMGA